ncbi:MAG: membrane protein insertase YidC, partial [Chitinispirillia bacterium]
MNKNTIIGFLIILISIQFFTSRFYYEKILRRPYPIVNKKETENGKKETKDPTKNQVVRDNENKKVSFENKEPEVLLNNTSTADSLTQNKSTVDTFLIETDKIICSVSEKGGNIISVKTKEYTYNTKGIKREYIELISNGSIGGLNLSINNKDYDNDHFECSKNKYIKVFREGESISLSFVYNNPLINLTITKIFTFFQGSYKIGYRVISNQLDGKSVVTGWKGGITESEYKKGEKMHLDPKVVHLFDGKNVEHITEKKSKNLERTGYYNWIGITSKYFLIAIIPDSVRDADITIN